jgi:hypothetical protein
LIAQRSRPQADADRHLGRRERERDQGLAVGPLPEPAAVPALHAHRVPALLHERGVVHDQDRLRAAHRPVGRLHQLVLERRGRPGRGGDEVVQLLEIAGGDARGHRLDALALAGQDQALEVDRRPAPLLLALQPRQERLEPAFELGFPAFCF